MKPIKLALATTVALGLAACAPDADDTGIDADETALTDDATAPGTVVEIAQDDGQFSTLVEAVTAANLGDALSGTGPFTVFAPTNDAFAKLPEGTVETLTTEDTDRLGEILQYHVVEGSTEAEALLAAIEQGGEDGYEIVTMGGGTLTATMEDGTVMLTDAMGNTAKVTATDLEASNGVIHVIDTVLMPN